MTSPRMFRCECGEMVQAGGTSLLDHIAYDHPQVTTIEMLVDPSEFDEMESK